MDIRLKKTQSGFYKEIDCNPDQSLELSLFLSSSIDIDGLIGWILGGSETPFAHNEIAILNESDKEIAICFIPDIENSDYEGLLIDKENFVQFLKKWQSLKNLQVPYITIKNKNNHIFVEGSEV